MDDRRKFPWLWLTRFARLAACAVAIVALDSLWHPVTAAGSRHSVVFVIDSSGAMAPHLPSIKAAIYAFADQSKPGDHLGIISVSDSVRLLPMKRISGPRDAKSVEIWMNTIDAVGEHSDIALGVARALEEVEQLKRIGDRNLKGIVVVSSSQSHGDSRSSEILQTTLEKASASISKSEWYLQYCYLDGVCDPQIDGFVSANLGLSYDIDMLQSKHNTETIDELCRIISEPERLCTLKILDLKGAVVVKHPAGKEWVPLDVGATISEKAHVRVAINSRAVAAIGNYVKLGLSPEAEFVLEELREDLGKGMGTFNLALKAGSIWLNFAEEPKSNLRISLKDATVRLSGKTGVATYSREMDELNVASLSESFSARALGKSTKPVRLGENQSTLLRHGQMLGEIEPVEPHLTEKWKSWSRALLKGAPLENLDFAVPELVFPEEMIIMGPIKSGKSESLNFPMRLEGVGHTLGLKMEVDISLALPRGLALSTTITDGEEPDTKVLHLKVDGSEGFRSGRTDTHKGLLMIVPAVDSQIVFEKILVPITITTKGPFASMSTFLMGVVLVLFVAAAVWAMLLLRTKESLRVKPHRVIGRLIVVNDPTRGRVGTLNLDELGTKSSRLSLVIGRDRTVEVRLKHASVSRNHCTIEAHLVGGRLETLIEPIGDAKVTVDDKVISSKTRLSDGARIGIGDFTYQFEDSQLYKKVDVVRRNGRQISGILDATGMDAEGFRLSPMDAVSPSERARIGFADIRSVTFYRRAADILSGVPRSMPKPDTMKRVELMFRKGNTISGYVQREYVEGRRRYVELLPLEPESEIDYTIIDYSDIVEKRAL